MRYLRYFYGLTHPDICLPMFSVNITGTRLCIKNSTDVSNHVSVSLICYLLQELHTKWFTWSFSDINALLTCRIILSYSFFNILHFSWNCFNFFNYYIKILLKNFCSTKKIEWNSSQQLLTIYRTVHYSLLIHAIRINIYYLKFAVIISRTQWNISLPSCIIGTTSTLTNVIFLFSAGVWSPCRGSGDIVRGRGEERGPTKMELAEPPSFKDQPQVWTPSRGN